MDCGLGPAKAYVGFHARLIFFNEEIKMKKNFSALTILTLIVLVSLVACGPKPAPPPPEAPPPQGEVVVVIGGDPSTLDPQSADDGNERAVNDNIYETLIARDSKSMMLIPGLAKSWERVNDTTWRFTLREEVKFHNGEDWNAEAAAYSINRVIDPEFASDQISYYATVKGAKVVDKYTIEVTTDGPDPTLPTRLYWMKMVPPRYTAENPGTFAEKPVGTGPYKFVEWVKGDHITLEANTEYWGGAPKVKTVVVRPIADEATRLAALRAGEVDLVSGLIPTYAEQVPKVAVTPGLEFPWLRLNTLKGPTSDPKVRQAINYAIDKGGLGESLYLGYAVLAEGQLLTPSHFGFNPEVSAYPYDPDKARSLLAEAGYTDEEIEFIGEAGRWLKDKELIEAVAEQLRDAGLNVNVKIVEWSEWLDLLFAGADKAPSIQFSSHDNALLDADRTLSSVYHSGGSQSAYKNEEVDKLVDEARTETDMAKREEMYHKAIQIAYDEAAIVPLLNLANVYGLSERLQWKPRRDGKILAYEMSLAE
jgi:peptide/nickel transport system substrate-binding protein